MRDEAAQAGGYLRRRRRRKWLAPIALSMTPMIDVVFLLLVYFVLVARFGTGEGALGLDMERAAAAGTTTEGAVRIEVVPEGDTYAVRSGAIDADGAVTTEEMIVAMRGSIDAGRVVTIAPGEGTSWEQALDAYSRVRGAGYTGTRLGVNEDGGR